MLMVSCTEKARLRGQPYMLAEAKNASKFICTFQKLSVRLYNPLQNNDFRFVANGNFSPMAGNGLRKGREFFRGCREPLPSCSELLSAVNALSRSELACRFQVVTESFALQAAASRRGGRSATMTESFWTYKEPPHSPFSVLEEPMFKDPGDGLGPMDFLDGMLWRRIKNALRGDISELVYCLRILARHEVSKYQNQAWSSRSPRHASAVGEAPSVADVLVLLGIAYERDDQTSRGSTGSTLIKVADWVIAAANDQRGIPHTHDIHIERWHDCGSPEQSRIPIEFDL